MLQSREQLGLKPRALAAGWGSPLSPPPRGPGTGVLPYFSGPLKLFLFIFL